jgi:hypothetical protein
MNIFWYIYNKKYTVNQREEILTKAIAIAKRNGFDISDEFFTEVPVELWIREGQDFYYSLIFDKGFAKSFWGEEEYVEAEEDKSSEESEEINLEIYDNPIAFLMGNKRKILLPSWQFHLMQMSLSNDPLEYISKFINNE